MAILDQLDASCVAAAGAARSSIAIFDSVPSAAAGGPPSTSHVNLESASLAYLVDHTSKERLEKAAGNCHVRRVGPCFGLLAWPPVRTKTTVLARFFKIHHIDNPDQAGCLEQTPRHAAGCTIAIVPAHLALA